MIEWLDNVFGEAAMDENDRADLADSDLCYVSITEDQLLRAQAEIASCISCNLEAEIPFDWLIRDVVSDRGYVDYIMPLRAKCPNCACPISEKTLVQPKGGVEVDTLKPEKKPAGLA
jgi:hypothetical protein